MTQPSETRPFVRIGRLSDGKRRWTKLYGVWNAMRGRCNSPGTKDYKRYGARGIRVCPEWDDYSTFRAWALSTGFRKGLTLDRIDVNGNYEPANCRWIPKGLQQDNRRDVHILTIDGVTKPLPYWSRLSGIKSTVIKGRVRAGWDHKAAVFTPVGKPRQPHMDSKVSSNE